MSGYCNTCKRNVATERDDILGIIVCMRCGSVMESNAIVSEVGFSETGAGAAVADGFQLRAGQARVASNRNPGARTGVHAGMQDSRDRTIELGHRKISDMASQPQIRMSGRLVEIAQRFYNIAVTMNFTKGRKTQVVVAVCLYVTCRMERTAHMLIDFADALSINVFEIGSAFVKFVEMAKITKEIPVIEPATYITRFATKLDFGEDVDDVIKDATRLVTRMKKDWIDTGRRPAGICAACE
ncbi:cyclin-like protein [Blyttiomyces helicus]|uniref:Cyclin-like protein n=1 Tax=Blyttiomyces helicus TaxID=388810 RepID=A0A4P9W0U1_9FUNG|nr:cyclin-like protein [Blyttiomyces helicus]|eukprot:RKO83666.1 cyclin-like protein [Blyttiomyces helicus]